MRYEYSQDSRSYLEKLRYPDFSGARGLAYYYKKEDTEPGRAGLYLGRVDGIALLDSQGDPEGGPACGL